MLHCLSMKHVKIGTQDTINARLVLEQPTPQVKTAGVNKVLDEGLHPLVGGWAGAFPLQLLVDTAQLLPGE